MQELSDAELVEGRLQDNQRLPESVAVIVIDFPFISLNDSWARESIDIGA